MLFSLLKLPFVQKVELNHMSKQSRTVGCAYRAGVILKDINSYMGQTISSLSEEVLQEINNKLHKQQLLGIKLELIETKKIKRKNFKLYCELADIYKLQVPNKKEYLKQIEIIKSLSIKV